MSRTLVTTVLLVLQECDLIKKKRIFF